MSLVLWTAFTETDLRNFFMVLFHGTSPAYQGSLERGFLEAPDLLDLAMGSDKRRGEIMLGSTKILDQKKKWSLSPPRSYLPCHYLIMAQTYCGPMF